MCSWNYTGEQTLSGDGLRRENRSWRQTFTYGPPRDCFIVMEVIVAVIKAFGRQQNEKRIFRIYVGVDKMKGRENNSTEHLQPCRQESFLYCSSSTGSAAALQLSLRGVISTLLLAFEDSVLSCCFVSGYTHYFVQPFVRELCRKYYAGWHRTLLTRIFFELRGGLLPDGVSCLTFSR